MLCCALLINETYRLIADQTVFHVIWRNENIINFVFFSFFLSFFLLPSSNKNLYIYNIESHFGPFQSWWPFSSTFCVCVCVLFEGEIGLWVRCDDISFRKCYQHVYRFISINYMNILMLSEKKLSSAGNWARCHWYPAKLPELEQRTTK